MKESINLAWHCEDDDFLESSIPITDPLLCKLQDPHEKYSRCLLDDLVEDEILSYMLVGEEVENALSQVSDFVTYTNIWHGRVLEEMGDSILTRIVNKQEEEKEFFVKIAKNKLGQSQQAMMIPGALFDWSFGYKGSNVVQQIWKLEFHQVPKPTPEAIQNMVKMMTMGFEHFYDDQD